MILDSEPWFVLIERETLVVVVVVDVKSWEPHSHRSNVTLDVQL